MKDRDTKQVGEPAKYQDVAERLCKDLKAGVVILIVLDGRKGNGVCVSTDIGHTGFGQPHILAEVLRMTADTVDGSAGPDGVGITSFKPTGEG